MLWAAYCDVSESHLADDIFFHRLLLVPLPLLTMSRVSVEGEERKTEGASNKNKHTFAFAVGKHLLCHLFIVKTETIKMMEENHAACG